MAVKIRLARGGAKKAPYYRVVVANSTAPRDGDFLEKIGTYNPMLSVNDPARISLKNDRVHALIHNGLNNCGNAQECVKACPKEIPLTDSIARANRQATEVLIHDLLRK